MVKAGVVGFKCFLCPSGVDEFPNVTKQDVEASLKELEGTNSVLAVSSCKCISYLSAEQCLKKCELYRASYCPQRNCRQTLSPFLHWNCFNVSVPCRMWSGGRTHKIYRYVLNSTKVTRMFNLKKKNHKTYLKFSLKLSSYFRFNFQSQCLLADLNSKCSYFPHLIWSKKKLSWTVQTKIIQYGTQANKIWNNATGQTHRQGALIRDNCHINEMHNSSMKRQILHYTSSSTLIRELH